MLQYAIRYFVIVSVVPALFVGAFAITVGAAAVRLASDPAAGVEALTPVLLLQLFVASSGFRLPARRGHFDLLLTSGAARWQIAIAHCLVSVAPGIASWICVGLLELVASHGDRWTAFATGTCVAFVGASIGAWGAAVHTSRMAAAIAWLLVMAIPSVSGVVSPVRLLGMSAIGSATFGVVTTIAAASLLFTAALWSITRGAAPLEAAQ